ncbi:hypothetical protein C0991_005002 [Blastosporella zonata]|nr:hypothetical protein C0991_005002 [Blastosporella zonata]
MNPGASGVLGSATREAFLSANHDVLGLSYSRSGEGLVQVDLTKEAEVEKVFSEFKPNWVIHCAAERRPDVAEKLNAQVPGYLALLSRKLNFTLVYISTDYVFDGTSPPYTPSSPTNPLQSYGQSKRDGELAVLSVDGAQVVVLRVPVLYGPAPNNSDSSINVLLDVVQDQSGKVYKMDHYATRYPTNVVDIGRFLVRLSGYKASIPPILHYSAAEPFTKYEICLVFAKILGLPHSHIVSDADAPTGSGATTRPRDFVNTYDDVKATRRASLTSAGPKAQRTSKTSQKLVVLPSAPQTRPLFADDEDLTLGYETDGVRELKSQAERMSKEQREGAGFKRITAYCVAESFKTKLLALFLKREHNVAPRVFDEALYVMYHLPLLPGYGPETNIRSSVPAKPSTGKSFLSRLSEAEEDGYQGTYFNSTTPQPTNSLEGYISSSSPVDTWQQEDTYPPLPPDESDVLLPSEAESEQDPHYASSLEIEVPPPPKVHWQSPPRLDPDEQIAEVVFFEYGVAVFFGLDERQERDILEDIEHAGIARRPLEEDQWEIEECHFAHDPHIAYPRIYNDFFTLKSRSHLLKLSIAHALAQSTLLARYETNAQQVLSSSLARSIPSQLAISGELQLRRRDALKLTGKLFKLRRDVNLVSNVLDVPELFWSEASLGELYEAVREYMEIKGRVQVLNEKLGVASDFLDAIHDHLNNNEMTRITWVVIWLIVIAVVVELGEILARLVLHDTMRGEPRLHVPSPLAKDDVLRVLNRMMGQSS